MPKILFWNVRNGTALPYVQAACIENDVDILILAEDSSPAGDTEALLNLGITASYWEYAPVPNKVRIFTRLDPSTITPVSDLFARVAIRSYRPPNSTGTPLLIVAAHVPSKLHASEERQSFFIRSLRASIEEAEVRSGHQNSLVIGDLNMNPFDPGMVGIDGMHGMMHKNLPPSRSMYGQKFSFFYNPMWSMLGDESTGPPGTYHYNSSDPINYFWNTFDQVLLRPSLLPFYNKGDVRVLTAVGTTSLLKNGHIDENISDHLPVFVQIDVE